MTTDDLAARLAVHLRREGVTFAPAELEAFVAAIPREQPIRSRLEALVLRFRKVQEATARAARRNRLLARVEGLCIAGIGFVLVGMAALFMLQCFGKAQGMGDALLLAVEMVFLATAYFGVILVDFGLRDAGLRRRKSNPSCATPPPAAAKPGQGARLP